MADREVVIKIAEELRQAIADDTGHLHEQGALEGAVAWLMDHGIIQMGAADAMALIGRSLKNLGAAWRSAGPGSPRS